MTDLSGALFLEASAIEAEKDEWKARALVAERDRDHWMTIAMNGESLRGRMLQSFLFGDFFGDSKRLCEDD